MAQIYTTYIRPKLEYASLVYSSLSGTLSDKLERFQRRAARLCLGLPLFRPVNHTALLHRVDWPTLSSRRQYVRLVFAFRLYNRMVPPHLIHTQSGQNRPLSKAVILWNKLPRAARCMTSLKLFLAAF